MSPDSAPMTSATDGAAASGAASKVASLFYLTPPIAAFSSYLLFGEALSALALAGMAVIVLGLYLLNRTRLA